MRVWKITSGILSIAIGAYVAYQSFFAGPFDAISGGQSAGTAGVVVAVMLLAGGIVSVAANRGSMAADIAMISLYGIGSLVGFTMAGSYGSLLVWAVWCLLCAALAVVDFFVAYFSDDDEGPAGSAVEGADAPSEPGLPTLRSLVLERSPKKREAAIDALPEREAKGYLKQVITAFINREAILPPELEDEEESHPGRTAVVAVACTAVVFIAGIIIFNTLWGGRGEDVPAPSAGTSAAVTAGPTQAPPDPSQGASDPAGTLSPLPEGGSGTLGDYTVEIQGAFIAHDFEGNPAIILTYSWTNNSERTVSAMTALSEKAFQNGVQIDRAVVYSRDTPGYESASATRDVRPGASSEVQCAFSLRDLTSPVEFEVSEFIGSSEDLVMARFDPRELNTVE